PCVSTRRMGKDGRGRRERRGRVRLDRVERGGARKALELTTIEQARIDACGKILKAGEQPATFTLLDQRLHCLLAHTLERAERVTDRSILDREEGMARVDVGREALDAATAHVLDEDAE